MASETTSRESFDCGEEDAVTDITIGADGRIYVFGASSQVLDILDEFSASEQALSERLNRPKTP